MKEIFEQGSFKNYSEVNLEKSMSPVLESSYYSRKTTVFISHKHDDLDDLKGVLGFLEKTYNVEVYIDSKDLKMPKKHPPKLQLILILDQPIDKLSAIISSFCVKLPCQATACLRSLFLTELILSCL